MKKNDICEVVIEDIGSNGEGIAHADGMTIFVPFALPGEECKVHVLKVKDNIAFAKVIEIIKRNVRRTLPQCPYFEKCGGCTLEHASREFELETKKKMIQTCLKKYAGIENCYIEMVDSKNDYGYRNKCAFPVRAVNGVSVVCMYRQNSHSVVEIKECKLAHPLINKIVEIFNSWLKKFQVSAFDEATNKGTVKFLVVRVLNEKALITIVVNDKKLKNVQELSSMFQDKDIDFGLNLNINQTNDNVILRGEFVNVCGFTSLEGNENGIKFPVGSISFMQVNDDVRNKIYAKAINALGDKSVVIDAYSGAGLMSAMVAKHAKFVYGIEIVSEATKNANELARVNGISNIKNINGDCAKELPKLVESLKNEQVSIILDPPRKGCDRKVIDSVVASNADVVVYISCNAATLARDAKILMDANYGVKQITGFNMFPQTAHVETIMTFVKG